MPVWVLRPLHSKSVSPPKSPVAETSLFISSPLIWKPGMKGRSRITRGGGGSKSIPSNPLGSEEPVSRFLSDNGSAGFLGQRHRTSGHPGFPFFLFFFFFRVATRPLGASPKPRQPDPARSAAPGFHLPAPPAGGLNLRQHPPRIRSSPPPAVSSAAFRHYP